VYKRQGNEGLGVFLAVILGIWEYRESEGTLGGKGRLPLD
jgi:hypothetical protein